MKSRILFVLSILFLPIYGFAVSPDISTGDVEFDFIVCEGDYIKIEVVADGADYSTVDFELNLPEKESQSFVFKQGTGVWNDYKVVAGENQYTLYYDGKKVYTSYFYPSKVRLSEDRIWHDADFFYGFGENSETTALNGKSFTIWNESRYGNHVYLYIPFIVTDAGDSVYYEAKGKDAIVFQDSKKDYQEFKTSRKRITSYYKKSADLPAAVASFYKATIPSLPMLPKWAFGFIQSKYGYKTQEEVVNLVNEFENKKIPLSAVVLDLYWFKRMGDLDWNLEAFPDPESLDNFLEEKQVKLITISEPFYSANSKNFSSFSDKEFLALDSEGNIVTWNDWWCLGDTMGGVINPIHPQAESILGNLYNNMLESGIDSFWTDLGEPENAPAEVTYNGISELDFHNYFNFYWSKNIYNGVTKLNPDKRFFLLSRSGFTGISRFGVSVWSGDVGNDFKALQLQIPLGLNSGISGLPYWGSDVGGFTPQNLNPEVFVRWYQFGAFTPVFRSHGTGPREPWASTKENEEIISRFINLRYTMLPYIYSTAWQARQTGYPIMRPVFYEDENIPEKFLDTEFMLGDFVFVSPVVESISEEPVKRFYLPKGNWYNLFSMKKQKGGKTIKEKSTLDSIPVYLKEGAIIPVEKDSKDYLVVIPGKNISSCFEFYNDDGVTNNYLKGDYVSIKYNLKDFTLSSDDINPGDRINLVIPASLVKDKNGWSYCHNNLMMVKEFEFNSERAVIIQ